MHRSILLTRPLRYSLLATIVLAAGCIERPLIESLPDLGFTLVTTGNNHACGVGIDGAVFCWTRQNPIPVEVSNGVAFQSVSTYWDHTCGVAVDGTGHCWGTNSVGQLGTDTLDTGRCQVLGFTETVPCSSRPSPVLMNLQFATIEVGAAHSCGLTTSGEIWCWGANGDGQLGSTSATPCVADFLAEGSECSFAPVKVDGSSSFVAVSTGLAHTCAIDDMGGAWCWGLGNAGRLGNGSTDNELIPALVTGGITWQTIDAGGSHSCGVSTNGGAYCWGSNSDFQLGSATTDLACGNQIFRCVWAPTPVSGALRFTSITASDAVPIGGDGPLLGGHSCGVTPGSLVYCWGLNNLGQLVNHNDIRSSKPIRVSNEYTFDNISAGQENTCGITTDEVLLCWAHGSPANRYWVFR